MAKVQYTQTAHLSEGHSKGITRVVFNPDGSLLATAGLDGAVCLWSTTSWSLLDIYYCKTPVTSLAWYTNRALVCGLQDGNLCSLIKVDGENLTLNGFWAHCYPIEHLAVREKFVASAAQREISIWHWNINTALACLARGIVPPSGRETNVRSQRAGGGDETETRPKKFEVLVTGIFWTQTSLILAFLNHGIRIYDAGSGKEVRVIDTDHPILAANLSPDGALLASSNSVTGFDIYDLRAGEAIRSFTHEIGKEERALPVSFIQGGTAIVGGSTTGFLNVWFVDSGLQLDPLHIPNEEKVLTLAGHYDALADRFLIATGIMNESAPSNIIIWTAQMPSNTITEVKPDQRSSRWSYRMILLCAGLAGVAAIIIWLWQAVVNGDLGEGWFGFEEFVYE